MKKILMLRSNPFEPDERVYKEAKSLIKNGYDVTLLCWDRELKFPPKDVIEGIEVERIRLKAGYGSLMELIFKMPLFWIKTFIRGLGKDFDSVHCYDYDTLPAGVWLKFIKGKKLVYDALELFLSYTANETANKGMFFIERIHLRFIDALIYTNQERLKIFKENVHLKERVQENTIIIHNYPELGLYTRDNNSSNSYKRSAIKNKEEEIIFQYNGGIKDDRNLLNILKAFKEVESENIIFLIIGNHYTDYGDVLKDYVQKNDLQQIVRFCDFIPLHELLDLLKKTRVGFVPLLKDSLNNLIPEPNKLYNYFATGNLAVVEDTPYLKKIVEDAGLGITCDFSNISKIKDSIEWVLQNQEKMDQMILKARNKYLDDYNWESQEKKLVKLYENLL